MMGRIFLANVGVNASHRFTSPIFNDGAFEFLPIPEDRRLEGDHLVRYRDLRSYYEGTRDLLRYVPRRAWDWPTHNDPEFDTFTYGDNCDTAPRAAGLKALRPGDFLFFLARLEDWGANGGNGRFGFYLVGFLHIAETNWLFRGVPSTRSENELSRFRRNAHVLRARSDDSYWDGFWVFRGDERSTRFRTAVPVTRELCSRIFTSADGSPWKWDEGRTDLQVIGSYTRSCRRVIDPGARSGAERADALWEWIERYSDGWPATSRNWCLIAIFGVDQFRSW
jgi:hypothetical protein